MQEKEYQIWGIVNEKPYETLGLPSNDLEFLEIQLDRINADDEFVRELCPDTDINIFEKFDILDLVV